MRGGDDIQEEKDRVLPCGRARRKNETCIEKSYFVPFAKMPHTKQAMTDYFNCSLVDDDVLYFEDNGNDLLAGLHPEAEMFPVSYSYILRRIA